MPWPFTRRKKEPAASPPDRPQAPPATDADQERVDEIRAWFRTHHADMPIEQVDDTPILHVGRAPAGVRLAEKGSAPAGAVLKVKRSKLAWVDLYDPALRAPVNALIKHLDRQQKWSFNGVVSTKYVDEKDRRP